VPAAGCLRAPCRWWAPRKTPSPADGNASERARADGAEDGAGRPAGPVVH
jgi:hypothetical protein